MTVLLAAGLKMLCIWSPLVLLVVLFALWETGVLIAFRGAVASSARPLLRPRRLPHGWPVDVAVHEPRHLPLRPHVEVLMPTLSSETARKWSAVLSSLANSPVMDATVAELRTCLRAWEKTQGEAYSLQFLRERRLNGTPTSEYREWLDSDDFRALATLVTELRGQQGPFKPKQSPEEAEATRYFWREQEPGLRASGVPSEATQAMCETYVKGAIRSPVAMAQIISENQAYDLKLQAIFAAHEPHMESRCTFTYWHRKGTHFGSGEALMGRLTKAERDILLADGWVKSHTITR